MATVKRITDLKPYATVLPYASEMFGVYQPLLGWKSRRIQERFQQGFQNDRRSGLAQLTRQFSGQVEVTLQDNGAAIDIKISPGALRAGVLRPYDSIVLSRISASLPAYALYDPTIWPQVITFDRLDQILKTDVVKAYAATYQELKRAVDTPVLMRSRVGAPPPDTGTAAMAALQHQLLYESSIAGALLMLMQRKATTSLVEIFYASRDATEKATALARALSQGDTGVAFLDLSNMDPQSQDDIQSVVLSPIGIVHLFRQYFFELDTFLGTPEKHVWLSPGSTVELYEVHTRRTLVEKTLETALDITTTAEKTTTQQDELSEAVKEDNQSDMKLGASTTASYGSISATASFDYGTSQQKARENTHKIMREQTEKLSTQIRRNFTSTFKTTTEVTDVSSTRHVLANTTESLINYELRRKMRQVSVQVQDIGTFLCWQCYVDDPGRDLGLAKLLHIAKPPDLDSIPHPEEIPPLQSFTEDKYITIPFESINGTEASNQGGVYDEGVDAENSEWSWLLGAGHIQIEFPQRFVAPKDGYVLTNLEFDAEGKPVTVSFKNLDPAGTFLLHVNSIDFQGQNSVQLKVTLHWSPTDAANAAIAQKNQDNLAAFKQQERDAYERAYVEACRDRVTTASKITQREGEDLREEERIVVYRRLVQDMLMNGVPQPDDRTRHVVAEVIDSMFDVDKMLYFVAPEWWRPRLHRSKQQMPEMTDPNAGPLGVVSDPVIRNGMHRWILPGTSAPANPLDPSTVGWGGINDAQRDSYYITDESEPAKLGSSLGWLLQLDGDNMRNAFLNAPWVKAVIPIRPEKEEDAINWLKGVEGMNGIDDTVIYHSSDPNEKDLNGHPTDGQKMIDVLLNLAQKIRLKYEAGIATGKYPKPSDVSDPALVDDENSVTSTPIDRVYEHGFFPLAGGFRANVGDDYEIFDQWLEILPTDQVVPVPVVYDPKTGRQV